MGRELCISKVGDIVGSRGLLVATTHLESPCPSPPTWDQMFSEERIAQANQAFRALEGHPNVVFCGDMNWDDKLDGEPPLPQGWCDAWLALRPNEVCNVFALSAWSSLSSSWCYVCRVFMDPKLRFCVNIMHATEKGLCSCSSQHIIKLVGCLCPPSMCMLWWL